MAHDKLKKEMLASIDQYKNFIETEQERIDTYITALNTNEIPKKIQDAKEELERLLVSENQKVKTVKEENMLKHFQQASGLEIRITDAGGVKLVFVNLDPADPNRIFFVILDVIDDKVWNVYDCNPHVSGLQKLLEELNATNNLSSFCKQLRGKFKDLTCKQ